MQKAISRLLRMARSMRFVGNVVSKTCGVSGLGTALTAVLVLLISAAPVAASEADLVLPDLSQVIFWGFLNGQLMLALGLVLCVGGVAFGIRNYIQLKNMDVHPSMQSVSELIYETCKTYLLTQGKFILLLQLFIAAVMIYYFGFLIKDASGNYFPPAKVATIVIFSLVGIAGSYGVAWYGIRVNTFANSRAAFASLRGKPFLTYAIPLQAGISIGMLLISVELILLLLVMLLAPADYAGPCFIGFAIGESLGAAALRIAGGIFTKIADIGSDLMKIVFNIKEDDARNPGVIADCTGDNAGDSVGPTADGFETYGVTGVALITFILLAVKDPIVQVQLLVWIFMMRVAMIVTSAAAYYLNDQLARQRYENADTMNFEQPLNRLVWITSIISIAVTYLLSFTLIYSVNNDTTLWWKLATIISCGTLAGAVIPELVQVFTSMHSRHVREVLNASREGGASLNILSGLTAGNFSCYWIGMAIVLLMYIGYVVSQMGVDIIITQTAMMPPTAPATFAAVFAFGLIAFGFLGMGPVTIAVDSYGPVTDNAQSVYELSTIETIPDIKQSIKDTYGFEPEFDKAKRFLEDNDGAGNTFKATAKPVLIGTAVVGATTLIFSIIVLLTNGLTTNVEKLSILYPPFLLGLIVGGAMIYWFTGASTQAVVAGAYKAVEFIKQNIKLDGSSERASVEDSKRVVHICTVYAQNGMLTIFFTLFFGTLAFACFEPFFFIGYLISLALFGLYQAIFMANAGGAWDNAKKLVEVELQEKNTPLHAATVVGDTVGDPFKDTSSVAINPVIKFTTLFGLLAVELANELTHNNQDEIRLGIAIVCFVLSALCVYRSFYSMRIKVG